MKKIIISLLFAATLAATIFYIVSPRTQAALPPVILVNLLSKELYDDAHIPGSLNIATPDLERVARQQGWGAQTPIVVYCSNYWCADSTAAAKKLVNLGFKNVYAFKAGMAGWYQAHKESPSEYPIVGPAKEPYLEVLGTEPQQKPTLYAHISVKELQKMLKDVNMLK